MVETVILEFLSFVRSLLVGVAGSPSEMMTMCFTPAVTFFRPL